jgi:dipeptidyl aminopeptidase/acylaminoacyl peptidase
MDMRTGISFLLIWFGVISVFGQQVTREDYKRAVSFLGNNLTNSKVFNANIQPIWAADNSGVAFVTNSPNERQFKCMERNSGKITSLFNQEGLAQLLRDSFKVEAKAANLDLTNIQWIQKDSLRFTIGSSQYVYNRKTNQLGKTNPESRDETISKSPDGKWIAFAKDYNLFLKSTETGAVRQLSTAGYKNYEYATSYGWGDLIEGENGERPSHFRVNWSPDSKWIQTYVCDLRSGNKMYLLDYGVDSLYRARLLSYYRASPGDTGMVRMIPVFFNTETGEEWRRDELRSTHTNPIGYEWSAETGIIYQTNRLRGYQQIDLHRVDLRNKQSELLLTETSNTNIDTYETWLWEEAGKFIFASERSGWRQLYSLDLKSKAVAPITNGAYYVNSIVFNNKKTNTIYFMASGKEEGRNPYYQHLYKVNLNGTENKMLTPENANHEVSPSVDGNWFVDNYSAIDQPTITVLRDGASGKVLNEMAKADVTGLLAMGYQYPETFSAIARDGKTTIYGAIWKPTNFDAGKKYPVIDQSYTGPHTNMFPRSFQMALGRRNQCMAELGFIVVTIDGMGTAGRSKAFHNVSYKNMGQNLLDHKLAIEQLAKKYAWIDIDRVGIFGHSAGGFDAGHAVLEFPDFYKVAVASSADHDFRMEKDWWPEMYMGWPVDSSYHAVSNITMAGKLKGKLLITHGGIDENVNPSATFKLAEALIKADKEFDMLILPSQHHGYTGIYNDYFTKKLWNYFVEHLLGAKPIWDFGWK